MHTFSSTNNNGARGAAGGRAALALLEVLLKLLDLLLGADEERAALVHSLGLQVQDAAVAGGARAAGLLRHRRSRQAYLDIPAEVEARADAADWRARNTTPR